jgi:hypothetical protein
MVNKPFHVTLALSPSEENRIKRFVGIVGYKSVREFIKASIFEKIHTDLGNMPLNDRQQVEEWMERV